MSINIEQHHNINCILADELLPCPFCGEKPETVEEEGFFTVYCKNGQCTAIGDCELCYCWIKECNEKSAIKRWNSRLVLFVGATEYIERQLSKE